MSAALFPPRGKAGRPPPADNRWYRKIAVPLMNTDETEGISINAGKKNEKLVKTTRVEKIIW